RLLGSLRISCDDEANGGDEPEVSRSAPGSGRFFSFDRGVCRAHARPRGGCPAAGGNAMGEHRSCSVTGRQLRGLNRAGGEYGSTWEGWDNNPYFGWPSAAIRMNDLDHFASKGMNVVRLPISWERLQHTLNGPLDPEYRCNLEKYVAAATAA